MKTYAAAPEPLGVSLTPSGVNVAVYAKGAHCVEICFFDENGQTQTSAHSLKNHTGAVFYDHITGIKAGAKYGFRVYGEYDPKRGLRFNPDRLLVDPYARSLDQAFALHPSLFDTQFTTDSAPFVPKSIVCADWPEFDFVRPKTKWDKTIVYEMHVRGFTKLHPDIPETIRGTFAGLGHPASITYLKELGITALELMPCAAWIDDRHLLNTDLSNYWGYNPVAFCAPDPRLAPNGWDEVRATVKSLAQAHIETLLDVVFNHTGEGDALGPTVCLKGFSNDSYYRLNPNDQGTYCNDAGTGNILNCDHPAVIRLIMDSLRLWAKAGIAGFRFDLASTLGRRSDGFDPLAPLLAAIDQDPALRDLKIIAEPWDCGPGGHRLGQFPSLWCEWNDRYRDTIRRFWRGDAISFGEFSKRFCGSQDIFWARRPSNSLNFITAHDGFTLADLTAYELKHNFANGEANQDGTEANFSCHHGHEGQTQDRRILEARRKTQCNLLATLLLSRGTPMLSMGAELGKSQGGNNNAFTQDNRTSWIEWDKTDEEMRLFTRRLIALRLKHRALHEDRFLCGDSLNTVPYLDVAWKNAHGAHLRPEDWDSPEYETLVAELNHFEAPDHNRVLIVFHRGKLESSLSLPAPRDGHAWQIDLDTDNLERQKKIKDRFCPIAPNSLMLLHEVRSSRAVTYAPHSDTIDILAEALGIETAWYSLDGLYTQVSQATKIAILSAMGFDLGSEDRAKWALFSYCSEFQYRALPHYQCADENREILLEHKIGLHDPVKAISLWIEEENGARQLHRILPGPVRYLKGYDGRVFKAVAFNLLPLKPGRYRLWCEGRTECVCDLTIAPLSAYLPKNLKPVLGLSAQLYGLSRPQDQGIGDFTTLKDGLKHARQHNVALLAINPLHILFRHNIDRASPYYPSDRRFLSPLYLDLPEAGRQDALADTLNYPALWAGKTAAIKARFDNEKTSDAFRTYVNNADQALMNFAAFEAISTVYGHNDWQTWPEALQKCDEKAVRAFIESHQASVEYFLFEQYLCEQQLKAATHEHGLQLGLCRDLAVGSAPDGAESWAASDLMAQNISIGAPPDPLGPQGQVWGLPPYCPHALLRERYKTLADIYRRNMRYAGALRIDHAMGLMRQFWVPKGMSAMDGAYVRFNFEALLAELKLESVRWHCMLIGEDLGTVPEGFRHTMHKAHILSYRVLPFERYGEAFLPPDQYPPLSFACVSTHDLPPLKGWWQGLEIKERHSLGLYTDEEAEAELALRNKDKTALMASLRAEALYAGDMDPNGDFTESLNIALHAYIAKSKALLAVVQIEDLAMQARSINLPGTDRERPNWRYRLNMTIEDIFNTPLSRTILDMPRKFSSPFEPDQYDDLI